MVNRMDDLISRQAAIDALVEELAYKPEGYWDSGLNQYDVEVVLNQQPSIDAVEIVRCKDCRWYKSNLMWDGKAVKICAKEAYEPVRKEDDFCSYGERKDE